MSCYSNPLKIWKAKLENQVISNQGYSFVNNALWLEYIALLQLKTCPVLKKIPLYQFEIVSTDKVSARHNLLAKQDNHKNEHTQIQN